MTPPERRVRIDLAYDGTDFAGWQLQPGARTVQGAIEDALRRLHGGRRVVLRGAGRTDAGVHARGQVADCAIAARFGDAELERALGRLLPDDVRPLRVRGVAPEFHARRARSKTYRYELDRSPWGDPLRARYALHWPHALDEARVARALAALRGRRDWSGFAGAACTVGDRVRDVFRADLEVEDGAARFVFGADGFLTHMVRNLVGTLLEIGRGRMPVERIGEILERGDRRLAGPTAPPRGLCLERVAYDIAGAETMLEHAPPAPPRA